MGKILIVDDDEGLIHFLSRFFSSKGYDVKSATEGRSALEALTREQFDLILLDYKMAGLSGLETLKEIRKSSVKTPVIIMTAYGTTETAIEAMKLGAYDYLLKPFNREELSRIVVDALEVNRLMKEMVSFPSSISKPEPAPRGVVKIVGSHRKMQEVYKLIGQVAEKDVTVLITGESGTGKELVARAIYHHSLRRDKPFLTVNCAAIPDTLFESELFGYERGAFTGAERTHIGKFERCNAGTLFFDEVGDLSLSTQAKLLRVLQEGEFERLGGGETIKVDVRVIAATNKNLDKEVEQGGFREDLYWRLKIISINMPPLRKRLEDIPALLDYLVGRFSEEYKKPIRHVADPVVQKLRSYTWPGNVRELENCIRRAVLLCTGDVIFEDHIKLESEKEDRIQKADREHLIEEIRNKLEDIVPDILRLSSHNVHANIIELVEETLILNALKRCGNNQVKAAKMLGISRNTLRHRIKKYNIKFEPEDTS
jgi:two-component system response regulator AtoC